MQPSAAKSRWINPSPMTHTPINSSKADTGMCRTIR